LGINIGAISWCQDHHISAQLGIGALLLKGEKSASELSDTAFEFSNTAFETSDVKLTQHSTKA